MNNKMHSVLVAEINYCVFVSGIEREGDTVLEWNVSKILKLKKRSRRIIEGDVEPAEAALIRFRLPIPVWSCKPLWAKNHEANSLEPLVRE